MRIGTIIQARMSSSRFPGKVLHRVAGKPMLQYLLERLGRCASLDTVVVATSREESDTPVARFCEERGVPCHRGPLADVAGRFLGVMDRFGFDAFVRVTGDSPLLDPRIVDRAVGLFREAGADAVTNVLERSFPKGQSVEVFRSDVFRRGYGRMREARHFEHVTLFFYENARDYRIVNFSSGQDLGRVQLSVDTPEDMARFEAIVLRMDRPHCDYGWREILDLGREAA